MGILNVTPDSFSDGHQLPLTRTVVERAAQLIAEGADVLDIGGESTRPGAVPVSAAMELDRVLPVIEAVRRQWPDIPLSIDTYKAEVATAAIRAGADIVNDVWGLTHGLPAAERTRWLTEAAGGVGNPRNPGLTPMAKAVAALACPVIVMHNRPEAVYRDFWAELTLDLRLSLALAAAADIPRHQLWLDPGFGFAKDAAQNLAAVRDLAKITALGLPVLLGTSRKSTVGRVLGTPVDDRLDGTGATLVWGIQQGCAMVRVHDVAAMWRYVRMADALKQGLDFTL